MSVDAPTADGRQGRERATLGAVCVAAVLLPISLTGASVALPDIANDLHSGLAPLQWVVNGYDLTFASVALAAGSFADRFGRRRIFVTGLLIFVICSILSAVAPDMLILDLARGAAGVGAAGVLTSGAALLAQTFEGAARARAFAGLGTAFGLGIAFGPVLCGAEVNLFGWRGVFLSHAVVAAAVVLVIRAVVQESRPDSVAAMDWSGILVFTGALSLFILTLIQAPQWGWTSAPVLAAIIACVALVVAFPLVEKRQASPLFDVTLLGNRRFAGISLVPVALGFGFTGVLILLPAYFASTKDYSAGRSGVVLMLLTVPTLLLPTVGGWMTKFTSVRAILTLSLLLSTAGAAALTVISPSTSVIALAPALILLGAGFGISLGILDGAAVNSVSTERAGMAAGMFSTMRLAGEVVAIAAMGSLIVTLTRSQLSGGLGRFTQNYSGDAGTLANTLSQGDLPGVANSLPAGATRTAFTSFAAGGYTDAFQIMLWLLAGLCALSALTVAVLLREGHATPEAAAQVEAARTASVS